MDCMGLKLKVTGQGRIEDSFLVHNANNVWSEDGQKPMAEPQNVMSDIKMFMYTAINHKF